jgi:hypothetical protein
MAGFNIEITLSKVILMIYFWTENLSPKPRRNYISMHSVMNWHNSQKLESKYNGYEVITILPAFSDQY